MNVVAQRLERRNIDDVGLIFEFTRETDAKQFIQRCKKGRQSLPGTCRRCDQRVRARLDGRPAALLWFSRRAELVFEPTRDDGMELKCLHRRITE